ncbi:MAG: PepSY domain-containing protein [Bacillus sp. (in: firmicutes)]
MKKYKKRIITWASIASILIISGIGAYVGTGYYFAKENNNYSESDIKKIALADTAGEVIQVRKEFELEDDRISESEFTYDVEIKTEENRLQHLEISARTGTIEIDD